MNKWKCRTWSGCQRLLREERVNKGRAELGVGFNVF